MSKPSVAIVIPWRPSPGRERNIHAAAAGFRRAFGAYGDPLSSSLGIAQVWVEVADSRHEPFNRAASRNAGVSASKTDVVIVCDADAIVEPEPLRAAVDAASDGLLHLPYTSCRMLSRFGSETVHRGADPSHSDFAQLGAASVGGCVVVSYDTWRAVGGWDERFVGWGFEDVAFWAAVDTLFGTVRHDGILYDLWHPDTREIGSVRYLAGKELCDRYTAALGSRHAMRALIEERACASV